MVTVRAMDGYAVEVPIAGDGRRRARWWRSSATASRSASAASARRRSSSRAPSGPISRTCRTTGGLADLPHQRGVATGVKPARSGGASAGVFRKMVGARDWALESALAAGYGDPDARGPRHGPFHLSRRGALAEEVPLPEIAAAVGTPVYVYSSATLTRHYRVFQEALAGLDHLICYAVKANSNLAVLALMGSLGAGMDVVSEGEYRRARAAGVPGERIVFSGVGKTRGRDAAGARGRHPAVQRRERARARGAERGGGGPGPGGADRDPGQPRRRRADAREDRHRQGGEQVRRADRAGARGLCPGGGAAGDRGGRGRRAYRQPADRARALRGGLRARWRS